MDDKEEDRFRGYPEDYDKTPEEEGFKKELYKYLMATDFETDTVNGRMNPSQFGVAGSFYDNDFGYYCSDCTDTDSVDKIFSMAESMAYHNLDKELYYDYYNYDGDRGVSSATNFKQVIFKNYSKKITINP